jgi:hypothetical protein
LQQLDSENGELYFVLAIFAGNASGSPQFFWAKCYQKSLEAEVFCDRFKVAISRSHPTAPLTFRPSRQEALLFSIEQAAVNQAPIDRHEKVIQKEVVAEEEDSQSATRDQSTQTTNDSSCMISSAVNTSALWPSIALAATNDIGVNTTAIATDLPSFQSITSIATQRPCSIADICGGKNHHDCTFVPFHSKICVEDNDINEHHQSFLANTGDGDERSEQFTSISMRDYRRTRAPLAVTASLDAIENTEQAFILMEH